MQQEHPSPLQLETKQGEIIHPLALMIFFWNIFKNENELYTCLPIRGAMENGSPSTRV
jgi:hypothetical protein